MAEMTQEDYSSQVIDTSFLEKQEIFTPSDNDVVALSNFSAMTASHDNLLQMEREMVKTLKDELPLKLKEYTSKYSEVVSHLQEEVVLWKFKFNQKVKAFDELKLSFEKQSKEKEDLQERLFILQRQKEEERLNNDGRISLSNDQGICCRSMITPFKSSTNSDTDTSGNLENTPDGTVTPHFSATDNSDKSNDTIVRNMEKMSKQKDDLPKPMTVAEEIKMNVDRKKSELKSETGGNFIDAYTNKKSSPEPIVENIINVDVEDLTWEDKEETIGEEIKVESEIENVTESGLLVERKRRKYERDFLLQCRYMQVCMEKPANLPDIDVILDFPQPPRIIKFCPLPLNKSKSRWLKKMTIYFTAKQSKSRWLRPKEREKGLSEEEKTTAELYRNVVAILNKLTPLKFKTLVEKMMALNLDSSERLEGVIDRIFEHKAIGEPVFCLAYANMCRCLCLLKINDADGNVVSFRKLLLNRCQKELEKEEEDEALLENLILEQLEGLSEEEQKAKKEELDEDLAKNKRRMLGNIKFIGELFKLKLLSENIMHDCISKLLRAGDEESLEGLCKLLLTIGKDLDSEKAKPTIRRFFKKINKIIVAKKFSWRVIFMLRDVVDLRENKWVPRKEERYSEWKKGGRDSPKPVANDGWIITRKCEKSQPIDQNKLRNMTKAAMMIPGQRNQHYMTAPSIAISQRPLRPGRTMYSSSSPRPLMMQEYAMPRQYQVLQEPYGQIMPPGFIQNIPQPYPLPVSTASFPQQFISQTQPPFYAGMPPMYYSHVQSNQPVQPQQPQQQPAPNAGISTNTNKARSKRPSKIIIKDPNSNKDITEEIRTHSGTANGRSTATPPLANTAAQTESSAIQAEFAAKVEARRAGGKLDGEKSEGTNKEKPSQGEKSRIDLKIIENGKTPRDQEIKDSPMQIEKNSANNAKLKNANVVDNSKKEDVIDFEAQQSSSNMKEKTKKETSYETEVKVLKADREQNGNIESDAEISYRSKEPDDVEKKILTKSDHLDFMTQKNGTELKSDLDSKQMMENNKESPNNSVATSDNIVSTSDNIVAASDNIVAASDNNVATSDHNPETYAKASFDKNQTLDPSAVTHDKNLIPPDDSEATPDIKPDTADNSAGTPENSTATPDNKEATFDSKTAVPDCKSANPNDSSPITSKSPANPDNNTENVNKDKDITKNSPATFDKDMPRFDDRKLTPSNDQGTPCKNMITPDKSSTSSDSETLGNLENTPDSTESPDCAAADKEPSAMNCDKSNDTIVKDMEKMSKQKDDLPKPTAVVKEIRSNANGKKSEMKSETDSKTKTKSEPAKEDKVESSEETVLKSDNKQAEKLPALKKSHSQADKPNQKQSNQRSQGKQSQPQATKPAEQPKKRSSKQRFKDINKKDTGGDLMDAYTEKKPSPEPVIEETVEVVPIESEKPLDEDLTWEDKGERIGEEIKVEIETEPVPPEHTKRKYERDFLVKFQYMQVCMEKPANLPDIDVILDVPQPPQSRTGSSGGGSQRSDFLPSYARPKNQPGGGKRDSRSKPPRKIIPMAPPPVVVLNKSENRWQRPEEKEKELSEEEKTTAELYRNVVAILNKLTPQKFKTLVEKIMALNIDSCERLEGVIDRIFEKAIGEPVFSVAYANMCRCLFTLKINDADGNVVSFRKLLLNRCQKEFEKEKEDEALLEKQKLEQLEGLSEEEQKAKKEELDEGLAKNKRRMLGNIKFIGELFKLKLLTENIMHDCIFKLLRAGDEESLESMCKLLFTIGKDLDSEKAKPRIVQYFDKINKVISAKKVSSRVIFMLRDVVDLRDNKWVPRREEHVNPKTIDQIHKEAEMEKQQEQKLVSQLPAKDKQQMKKGSSGGRDSPKPVANDGWITTGKGGKSQPIDQNKLRNMAKRANNEQISLGPSSRFGQWGRGSSAGLNNSSQEQEQPQGNRYSALQSSSGDPSSGRVLYDPRRSNSTGARTSSAGPRGSDKSRQKSGRESAIEAARALSNTSSEKSHYTPSQSSASQEKQPEVKENENKNETVNESLREEELAKKTIALIDEYANIKDVKEAVACFTDLNSPSLHYFFVSTSVEYTYEKSMKVRGDTGRLLAELLSLNKLSKEQLLKGFNNIFEAADENSMDYPKLWNYLAEIINPLLGDRLKLNDLKPLILQHLAPIGKAAVLFAEILLEFKKSTCESEVVKLWNELEIDWSNILPPRLTIDEFLSKKNLNFLSAEANDELLKLLCASQLRNDIVFAHIEKNFKEEKRKEAEFINYLVSSVAESCLIKKEKETGPDCCEAKLKARRDILKKYLDNNMKLQLEALFTLQKIYAKYDKPKDMLSKFFNTLYDEEVITEGAFLNWKQDEDHSRQEAKGLALQATSSFFEWLQSAAVEGGEN